MMAAAAALNIICFITINLLFIIGINRVWTHLNMFLPQPIRNKYTVGKALRKAKGLRKKDHKATLLPESEELRQYR